METTGAFKNTFWAKNFTADLVLPNPEITELEITADDEFLILACDGLWDVFDNQDAVDVVRMSLEGHRDPKKATEDLVDEALRNGSMYNISVLIVFWNALGTSLVCSPPSSSEFPQTFTDSETMEL